MKKTSGAGCVGVDAERLRSGGHSGRLTRQGPGGRRFERKRRHSGRPGRPIQGRLGALLTEQPENKPLALMWFNIAAANGNKDAADKANGISRDMTPAELADAALWQKTPQARPCEWNDVYPEHKI